MAAQLVLGAAVAYGLCALVVAMAMAQRRAWPRFLVGLLATLPLPVSLYGSMHVNPSEPGVTMMVTLFFACTGGCLAVLPWLALLRQRESGAGARGLEPPPGTHDNTVENL